ncbi:MAG TPA: CPBP family intramembrane glutamic endopeptidase [Candidatus Dormibacteraeota bacterium]|nr:CPBP family intramembrane glutamic endopeptidase [Candidatus Dormibacteraeota bacterium]
MRIALPDQPAPAVVMAGSVLAYLAFAATFRGPRKRFWQRMTGTAIGLGSLSLLSSKELRRQRLEPSDLALGAAIATGLYGVFAIGDRAARVLMPNGDQDIGNIYELRRLRSRLELALRLALVIAPAEELFWRGLLQGALGRRLGRSRAAALSAALYGGAHLCTGNPTLVGAATVAGAGWSGLAAIGTPMPALVVSHCLWDVWIFLVRPTRAVS